MTAFHLYGNAAGTFLIVTGVGKVRAAAAVGFLAARAAPSCWINVGTAGHPDLPVGTVRLAHKIVDRDSGRAFYPQWVIAAPTATDDLVTVSRPASEFPETALHDMEAAGFCEAARHFATLEWIHVVKVVSDNRGTAFQRDRVGELMAASLPVLERLLADLGELRESVRDPLPFDVERIAATAGLTRAQTRQMERLLRRWQALSPDTLPTEAELCRLDRATLLPWLRRRLRD